MEEQLIEIITNGDYIEHVWVRGKKMMDISQIKFYFGEHSTVFFQKPPKTKVIEKIMNLIRRKK